MQPCKDFYVNQHNSTNWKIRAGMSDIETMMLDQNTSSLGWTGHQKLAWRAILQDLQLGKATNNGDVVCLSWHVSNEPPSIGSLLHYDCGCFVDCIKMGHIFRRLLKRNYTDCGCDSLFITHFTCSFLRDQLESWRTPLFRVQASDRKYCGYYYTAVLVSIPCTFPSIAVVNVS